MIVNFLGTAGNAGQRTVTRGVSFAILALGSFYIACSAVAEEWFVIESIRGEAVTVYKDGSGQNPEKIAVSQVESLGVLFSDAHRKNGLMPLVLKDGRTVYVHPMSVKLADAFCDDEAAVAKSDNFFGQGSAAGAACKK